MTVVAVLMSSLGLLLIKVTVGSDRVARDAPGSSGDTLKINPV
jgi:hypothetical protein